jgi:hypothetical protein
MAKELKSKDTYSDEEKKWILERLDAERKERQKYQSLKKSTENKDEPENEEPKSEKEKILEKINEDRRIAQKYKELQRRRLKNKKVHKLENKTLYKILNMNRTYYINVEDSKRFSSKPQIFPIYYQGFDGLKRKDVLIQIKDYSDKIFLSEDVLKVYYKQVSLEDNPQI